MMPLWIFSLGKLVFHEANIEIPYANICAYGLCLVVPLGIGILISRFLDLSKKRFLELKCIFFIGISLGSLRSSYES